MSQFALLGHQVQHGAAIDAQRLVVAGLPATTAASTSGLASGSTWASTSTRPVSASSPAPGHRAGHPDGNGHAAGDITCLTLAHLLLTGPPEGPSGFTVQAMPPDRIGRPLVPSTALSRDRSPALPRGPPARTEIA